MSDLFDQVTSDQDPFKKIASKIPGFSGYIERQNRRAADKMLRESIADQFTELWKRVGNVQQDLISQGEIASLDDMEKAATKLQTFIDKVTNAAYGYAGFFDAKKIKQDELARLYDFDVALLDSVDAIAHAIDNIEASIGSDGFDASIRNLITLTRELVSTFDSRGEVITSADV